MEIFETNKILITMKNKNTIDPMYAMANGLCRICGKNISDLRYNQPCNEEVNCLSNLPDDSLTVVSNIENVKQETKPCTIHGVMWRILFIVVCACVWAVSYQLIQMLPTFWHVGTPMFIGWVSHMVYQRMFS